jgi:hypothetical protein
MLWMAVEQFFPNRFLPSLQNKEQQDDNDDA